MNIKQIYGGCLQTLSNVFGVDTAKKIDTFLRFRKILDLKNPTTLADKVSYIELHMQSPLASTCTDKYAVREYVAKKGFSHSLIPLVGGPWEKPEDVDFSFLPDSFVLKATHGCKMNYLVADKSKMDFIGCKKEMQRWIATTYGTYSMEPHYLNIPHRIYAEEYLDDADKLIDYKFHCMNGEPQFVLTVTERKSNGDKAMQATLDLFDMEWNPIYEVTGSGLEIAGNGNVPKPPHFEEMIEMARKLSEDFKFVRVDLYEKKDMIYFGELTFSPAACVFPYLSEDFLLEMGNKLVI